MPAMTATKAEREFHKTLGVGPKRDYEASLRELDKLRKDVGTYHKDFIDFEHAFVDAYTTGRVSSYRDAERLKSEIGIIVEKLATYIPSEAISIKRLMQQFHYTWSIQMPDHFNSIFKEKRSFLVGPLHVVKRSDAATHYNWIVGQLKQLRKIWARLDYFVDEAIKTVKDAQKKAA